MPAPFHRTAVSALAVLWASLVVGSGAVWAQGQSAAPASSASAPASDDPPDRGPGVVNSPLDAQLFYQLLIGELELRGGQAGTAYEVVLDAARRTKDEQLFRRATDIALQARAGEQALAAVVAWRKAVPASLEAHRYLIQMLVALNRLPDTVEPLRSLINATPLLQRPALINSLPQFFARTGNRAEAATLLEQVLAPYIDAPETRATARTAIGRAWLMVPDPAKALDVAQRAHQDDPTAEAPAFLALELMPLPAAEAVVTDHLKARPDSNGVRLLYVRGLTESQRFGDAVTQLDQLTQRNPTLAPPLLTLGALQLELRRPADAAATLQKYLQVAADAPAPPVIPAGPAAAASAGGSDDDDDDNAAMSSGAAAQARAADDGRTQAWLLLAQAAEQQGDLTGAETWLAKIDNPQRALEVQSRRASLLARQGKVSEARELIRKAPEKSPQDARAKLLAEAQLMRDLKRWPDAHAVLAQANQKFPDDPDLLYEQSMIAEKLNRIDEMERLLRQVIALKPDHQHAYNALGYSLAERNTRLPEAKQLIQKALEMSPGEPFITDSLGWVEYRMGNTDEALRLLRSAYQSRPDPEIAAHLGEVLWVAGQREDALKVWREGRSRDGTNDVLRETLARLRVDL